MNPSALQNLSPSAPSPAVTPCAAPHALTNAGTTRIRLWDAPMRVFHWSLLAAVATAIVTGKLGGDWMGVHGLAGRVIVGLLAFRVIWGLVGSTAARFATFWPTPAKLRAYLQGTWQGVGHNPLGALSVLALLGLLATQAGTGLFGNDDIAFSGPLAVLVSEDWSQQLTRWHHQLATVLYVLLGLHTAAIAFYAVIKKNNLVRPMVTGWKEVTATTPAPRHASLRALVVSVLLGWAAAYAVSGSWIHQGDTSTPPATSATQAPATV